MEILKLNAPCKDYIWGGNRLREEYGKVSDADKIAESWELSCHKDGQSVIANGKDKGKTLSEYVAENKNVLGTACGRFEYFPILIKLIDAKDNLSVQVHPDNDYAMRVEGEYGKTEMWYIVDCEEGSQLIYGFDKEISREEFADRIIPCLRSLTMFPYIREMCSSLSRVRSTLSARVYLLPRFSRTAIRHTEYTTTAE